MQFFVFLSFLVLLQNTKAHGGHDVEQQETNEQYAARHMSSEHHIDSFDVKAFFHLHDLNRDGVWDRDEIEAIYGVHHVYSQKLSADEKAHQAKADTIVATVLRNVDKDGDGKITPKELEQAGLNSLPSFTNLGAEGHHYDVESEFFLHHEEVYHSTPDTQTDESYNHPEDIEHFAMHEQIEAEEEARERRFQGLPVEEPTTQGHHSSAESPSSQPSQSVDTPPPPPAPPVPPISGVESLAPDVSPPAHPHDDQKAFDIPQPSSSAQPKLPSRETPPEKLPPEIKYEKAAEEGRIKSEWGQGSDGYKRPRTAADRLRKNLPYKYKFRRNWGDF